MAFSLLVELTLETNDWKNLNKNLITISNGFVEFFPIPNFQNKCKNYLGVSITIHGLDVIKIDSFKDVVKYLIGAGHRVFELYSQAEFNYDNVEILANKFLKPK